MRKDARLKGTIGTRFAHLDGCADRLGIGVAEKLA